MPYLAPFLCRVGADRMVRQALMEITRNRELKQERKVAKVSQIWGQGLAKYMRTSEKPNLRAGERSTAI